jgi:hypothetical protein
MLCRLRSPPPAAGVIKFAHLQQLLNIHNPRTDHDSHDAHAMTDIILTSRMLWRLISPSRSAPLLRR